MSEAPGQLRVLNVGVTRYRQPLDATQRSKFARLSELALLDVVGLSADGRSRRFREGATFHLVPLVPSALLRFALVSASALVLGLRRRRSLEVLLCESPYEGLVGVVLRGLLAVLGHRVVLVVELHGEWESSPFLYRRVPLRGLVAPVLRVWTRFVLRRADLVRAVSRYLKAEAERVGVRVDAVFPTFTDFDLFLDSGDDGAPVEPSEPPAILYVGGLYPIKGLETLGRAFGELLAQGITARLVVVGAGPYREALEAALAAAGVAPEAVRFRGTIAQSEVRREMRRCRLLVLPSLSEGLPRVIMEAMACARPVVASSVGGIPELVEDGMTGYLVPPGDSAALAERMRRCVESEELARRLGAHGREKAERELSSTRYFESYRSLFERARELASPRR